jgi:hypothetical protein
MWFTTEAGRKGSVQSTSYSAKNIGQQRPKTKADALIQLEKTNKAFYDELGNFWENPTYPMGTLFNDGEMPKSTKFQKAVAKEMTYMPQVVTEPTSRSYYDMYSLYRRFYDPKYVFVDRKDVDEHQALAHWKELDETQKTEAMGRFMWAIKELAYMVQFPKTSPWHTQVLMYQEIDLASRQTHTEFENILDRSLNKVLLKAGFFG